ncbi:outer membrane beta-barrel protein [Paraneptunicella aestuarii]|uniref:outer membrane protein n=1 Tax=Paraneptunicella aestuarii TaxID=2831148 RepID=UPI001E2B85CC|nr:outer membrane beta-barrel protein [Paraneptunicella aestuarii]UAA38764.1 outer membrane beta-barrel protein [Paraneptunicella aestuarii]
MKKTLLAITLAALSSSALAADENYYVELGVSSLSEDFDGTRDFEQMAISGTAGYNFNPADSFQHKAELMFGFGHGSDKIKDGDVTLELNVKNYYGIAYRPTYMINDELAVFGRLAYARAKTNASLTIGEVTVSASDSESETGYGAGISYGDFSVSYTKFDDSDFITAAVAFKF